MQERCTCSLCFLTDDFKTSHGSDTPPEKETVGSISFMPLPLSLAMGLADRFVSLMMPVAALRTCPFPSYRSGLTVHQE